MTPRVSGWSTRLDGPDWTGRQVGRLRNDPGASGGFLGVVLLTCRSYNICGSAAVELRSPCSGGQCGTVNDINLSINLFYALEGGGSNFDCARETEVSTAGFYWERVLMFLVFGELSVSNEWAALCSLPRCRLGEQIGLWPMVEQTADQ